MTTNERENYNKTFNVRLCDRCCGSCRYFERQYEECGCTHPRQFDYDYFARLDREHGCDDDPFGALGFGIFINEGYVCDLWEQEEPGK